MRDEKGRFTSEGRYEYFLTTVKEHGMKDECLLWPYGQDGSGYGAINITNIGPCKIYQLALEIKLGRKIKKGLWALHAHSGNRNCYAMAHLREGTRQDNMDDMVKDGTKVDVKSYFGVNQWKAVLSDEQVLEIRKTYIPKIYTQQQLADEYGVSRACISAIVKKHPRNWKHV